MNSTKVVFVDGVRQCVPVIPAITFGSLAKLRVGIVRLRNPGLTGHENERGVINAIEHRSLELFLDRLRWQMFICAHGAKIRNDIKECAWFVFLQRVDLRQRLRPIVEPDLAEARPKLSACCPTPRQDHRAGPHPQYRTIPSLDERHRHRLVRRLYLKSRAFEREFHPRLLSLPENRCPPAEVQKQEQMISWRTSYKAL